MYSAVSPAPMNPISHNTLLCAYAPARISSLLQNPDNGKIPEIASHAATKHPNVHGSFSFTVPIRAECISADTGVGSASASGSPTYKGTSALSPHAPTNSSTAAAVSTPTLTPACPPLIASITPEISIVPKAFHSINTPSTNPA